MQAVLIRVREGVRSPALLVQLAEAYFDLADDWLKRPRNGWRFMRPEPRRRSRRPLRRVERAAPFFHTCNLGGGERLQGITNAALVVKEIKHCAMRAIEINPKHAQALQLMGGLLMELPWFLGGDEKKAQEYLERAIAADGNFTNARILVAKLYKKQGRIDEARQQLESVIRADHPHYRYAWERTYKPEAERLLKEMAGAGAR